MHAVWLVSGIQGAGKTTVARALASRLPRAAHVEADVLAKMIVSGLEWWREDDPDGEGARQLRLRGRNLCLLADSFFEAGITPVIDELAIGWHFDDIVAGLRARPLYVVFLAPRLEVAIARYNEHPYENPADDIDRLLDAEMRRKHTGVGLWLDTSEMTVRETVEAILARAPDEATV